MGGEVRTVGGQEEGRGSGGIIRRRFLIGAAGVGAAAWVAPAIITMDPAGAAELTSPPPKPPDTEVLTAQTPAVRGAEATQEPKVSGASERRSSAVHRCEPRAAHDRGTRGHGRGDRDALLECPDADPRQESGRSAARLGTGTSRDGSRRGWISSVRLTVASIENDAPCAWRRGPGRPAAPDP